MCHGIELTSRQAELAPRWSHWIRQSHRWLSMAFTLTVVANFIVRARGEPPAWVTYSPLLPLFLLLFSGLYMFALPYARRWRSTGALRQA
jgi:hypothetical protein